VERPADPGGAAMPRPIDLPGHLIFAVCDRFLKGVDNEGKRVTAGTLSEWLQDEGFDISREGIYRVVRIGLNRGYLQLCPPRSAVLELRVSSRFPDIGEVHVYDVRAPNRVVENLSDAAADLVFPLIKQIDAARNPDGESGAQRRPVHVGFGGGATSLRVAETLARRLRSEYPVPRLKIHALSSGFDISRPLTAPGAFFSLFQDLDGVEFAGLFCPPIARAREYPVVRNMTGIQEAFDQGSDVDIVVSSLAQADDPDGLLNWFYERYATDRERDRLREIGHVGDVLWQPYSPEGPLETDSRAFVLFDIPELVRMSADPNKHVVLVGGPCVVCGRTKERALLPLLSQPALRVFDHLVTDVETVEALLALLETAGDPLRRR
jgi:hypothetical protein